MTTKLLGTFQVTCGLIRVTDPCYAPDGLGSQFLAKDGTWIAEMDVKDAGTGWGPRCHELVIHHCDFQDRTPAEATAIAAFVDSGQCGFFDADRYAMEGGADEPFYGTVCALTFDEADPTRFGGVIEWGAVSSSGHGDGCYSVLVSKEDNKVVAARLIFIEEGGEE